ncbi:hypothetical protein P7K49_012044 [Saguinus oedipus]|uniref:Uncharacterized protein n=1 Tax=Saguinus oedipus TaxID=9490 RepID=A0ABQ9VVX3_SAGOE|nr:hypothetical protein P7K49_012044 [Saguinus oedipus]
MGARAARDPSTFPVRTEASAPGSEVQDSDLAHGESEKSSECHRHCRVGPAWQFLLKRLGHMGRGA